jgi:hypothetical protein
MSHLKIITGHYGSGKTEFCVHYAIRATNTYQKVAVVDLDIVNPYFRSREKKDLFSEYGIEILGSSTGIENLSADLPALPPQIEKYLQTDDYFAIFDVGGDGEGARVLSRYAKKIINHGYDMYLVVNANRPGTAKPDQVIQYINDIEAQSRLTVQGLINNTHMLHETTLEDITRGYGVCTNVAMQTGLPILYNVIPAYLKNEIIHSTIENVFILDELYMRPEWL